MSHFYRFALYVTRGLFFLLLPVTFKGREKLPASGGYIVAPNHISMADPIIVAHGYIKRQIHYMAKEEFYKNGFLKALFNALGVFPVSRGKGDMEAINRGITELRDGALVGIFPEGTRMHGTRPGRGKSGAALIAKNAGVGVIPCAIITKGNKIRPFKRVIVKYGDPITNEELFGDEQSSATLKHATKLIMARINLLMDEEGVPREDNNG